MIKYLSIILTLLIPAATVAQVNYDSLKLAFIIADSDSAFPTRVLSFIKEAFQNPKAQCYLNEAILHIGPL